MIEGNGGLPQGGTSGENIFGLPYGCQGGQKGGFN